MAKAKIKTVVNDASVEAFIESVSDGEKRADSWDLVEVMQKMTGEPPKMWGSSIIGFGRYEYRYESGREGEMPRLAFSPRKSALTIYIMPGFEAQEELLARLGKHKTGRSCLYLKRLSGVDRDALDELLRDSLRRLDEKYPES